MVAASASGYSLSVAMWAVGDGEADWYGFDDAIYGSARFVALFSAQDKPMTELPGWPASFATREINIPCPDNAKFAVVEKVKAHFRALYDTIELDGARYQGRLIAETANKLFG